MSFSTARTLRSSFKRNWIFITAKYYPRLVRRENLFRRELSQEHLYTPYAANSVFSFILDLVSDAWLRKYDSVVKAEKAWRNDQQPWTWTRHKMKINPSFNGISLQNGKMYFYFNRIAD